MLGKAFCTIFSRRCTEGACILVKFVSIEKYMGIHFTSFLWSKVPTLRLYLHCSDIAPFHRKSSWGYGENHHVEANCKLFLLSSWWIVEPETLVWLCRYDEYWFIWWNLYSLKLLIWTVTNSGSFLFFPLIYIEFPFNRSCYSYCYCSTTDLRIPWIITKSLFFVENKKNKSETVLLVFWSEIFFYLFYFFNAKFRRGYLSIACSRCGLR